LPGPGGGRRPLIAIVEGEIVEIDWHAQSSSQQSPNDSDSDCPNAEAHVHDENKIPPPQQSQKIDIESVIKIEKQEKQQSQSNSPMEINICSHPVPGAHVLPQIVIEGLHHSLVEGVWNVKLEIVSVATHLVK